MTHTQKPNYYLITASIHGRPHNLSRERFAHHSSYSWGPVLPHLGHAAGAEIYTEPTQARTVFRQALRAVMQSEAPFFKAGIDIESLYLEGVYIQHRRLDPENLESGEERKARLLARLASGGTIGREDAEFLKQLIG